MALYVCHYPFPLVMSNSITINGVDYVRADSVPAAKPNGNRAVVVAEIFCVPVSENWGLK